MSDCREVIIYGAGGSGREIAWLLRRCHGDTKYDPVCFVDDDPGQSGEVRNGLPIWTYSEALCRYPEASVVPAIGDPHGRVRVVDRIRESGRNVIGVRHESAIIGDEVVLGTAVVVAAGTIITTNVVIGDYVQINVGCTVSHDVKVGDYATLSPGVHIAGRVKIGRRAFIGIGAVVLNGTQDSPIIIGDDAIVGAGSCVINDVEEGATVMGIPARPRQGR